MNNTESKKDQVRPIYSELQGYLEQSPLADNGQKYIFGEMTLANQVNAAIDELAEITSKDFNRFKIEIKNIDSG
ncbi:MAG: hypothetical protein U5L75_01515 [Candidatus Campbellbacteria bacterium]|nr:hypothetical protein [Candidatus Campbellbacteria bacterium]